LGTQLAELVLGCSKGSWTAIFLRELEMECTPLSAMVKSQRGLGFVRKEMCNKNGPFVDTHLCFSKTISIWVIMYTSFNYFSHSTIHIYRVICPRS
jgi:hypothetical protein